MDVHIACGDICSVLRRCLSLIPADKHVRRAGNSSGTGCGCADRIHVDVLVPGSGNSHIPGCMDGIAFLQERFGSSLEICHQTHRGYRRAAPGCHGRSDVIELCVVIGFQGKASILGSHIAVHCGSCFAFKNLNRRAHLHSCAAGSSGADGQLGYVVCIGGFHICVHSRIDAVGTGLHILIGHQSDHSRANAGPRACGKPARKYGLSGVIRSLYGDRTVCLCLRSHLFPLPAFHQLFTVIAAKKQIHTSSFYSQRSQLRGIVFIIRRRNLRGRQLSVLSSTRQDTLIDIGLEGNYIFVYRLFFFDAFRFQNRFSGIGKHFIVIHQRGHHAVHAGA